MNAKRLLFPALALLLSAAASLQAATTIGVNFQGRDNNSNPTPALGASEVAGLVPQGNWNNIDDKSFSPAENGVTPPLNDSTGAATAVTLTFAANDSWNNDVAPGSVTSPNAKLMNGIIKANGADTAATFTFDNLPATGTYDIYMYMNENGNGALLDVTDGVTTYFVSETHQFLDTDSFKEAKNTTDPGTGGTRDVGNYVKFTGISGASQTISVTHRADPSNNDGAGIAGFQIVSPSGATPVSIGYQPQPQSTTVGKSVIFSVTANGPYTSVQWQKKAAGASSFTDIPGATSLSYATPTLVAGDDGTLYHVVLGSASGPITSSDVKLTVNNDTTPPTLLSASGSLTKVRLVFNEPLDLTTATAKANYSLDKGVTVSSATSEEVGSGNAEVTVVTLTVTGATAGTAYTVTVNGIKDKAGNTIAANTHTAFYLYQQVVSVNFQGRDNDGSATDPLNAAEVAGIVQATVWNNIDDNAVGNNGTSNPLLDNTAAATPITVTFSAQDSWNNDTDPTTIKTGSARMMNGIIKVGDPNGATGGQAIFTFDNMPTGGYDVYVYMNENGDGTQLNVDDGATTYYVTETHQFSDTSSFILAQNTSDPDAGGTRDVGNYVKFTGETATSLTITATHILNSDGCGIAGFQIVQPSGPTLYPPATITITAQPQPITVTEGRQGTLSVTATTTSSYGLTYQWKKAGVAIPGATSSSYKLPVQQLSDNGVQYTVDINALGAPAVTSSPVTVTVIADTVPPQLLSAGSLKTFAGGDEVSLIFDETLAPSSVSPLSNFTLTGGAAVTAARIVTNSSGLDTIQAGIILTVTGITPGNSYTVTVKGVSDTHNNPITTPQTMTFTASRFSWVSLGDTANGVENDALAIGTNSFNVVNGGNAFWGTEDDITMVYEKITGDFDRQAQVEWNDPSSNWARAGLSARESIDPTGVNPISRYQMVISDPVTKFNGAAANDSWETNRRLNAGGATDSIAGGSAGGVRYPNSYVRIKRVGDLISVFYSTNFQHWQPLGTTDFINQSTDGPLTADMFVGPTMGAENGNIIAAGQDGTVDQQGAFASRFRNYGPVPQEKGLGTETYSIGLNVGANEGGGQLSPTDVAGVDQIAQANWNNIFGNDTTVTPAGPVVANSGSATPVTVDISGTGNTWASEGTVHGENNNLLTGNDAILMTGYLDTGATTTTKVQISNIPSNLTTPGYDVVVYALGGVGNKGGSYRVTDAAGAVLADYVAVNTLVNPSNYVAVGSVAAAPNDGNYIVFKNLKAATIVVEATTDGGLGTGNNPRAPINAIQLVTPSGLTSGGGGSTVSISMTAGSVTISSSNGGTVQATGSLTPPISWQDLGPAPQTVTASAAAQFFRVKN